MKLLILTLLVLLPGFIIAQNQKTYSPIDSVGWELPDLSNLDEFILTDDPGSVTYLLVMSKSGRIKKVNVLENTFTTQAEAGIRNQLEGFTLNRKPSLKNKVRYKGTLAISIGTCKDSRD